MNKVVYMRFIRHHKHPIIEYKSAMARYDDMVTFSSSHAIMVFIVRDDS